MSFRVWLLSFLPWRIFCGRCVGRVGRRFPDLGYALGYHCGLAFSMMAWSAANRRWQAYWALRDEMRRRGYRLPDAR